jgi:hypothetical protein
MAFGKKKTKKNVKNSKVKKTTKIKEEEIIEDDDDDLLDSEEDEDSIFDNSEDEDEEELDDEDEIEDEDEEDDDPEDNADDEEEEKPIRSKKKKVVESKKKAAKRTLSAPKGTSTKELKNAERIILKGFKDKKNENDIKTDLALSGLNFSKIILLYKFVTIEHDLVKSPREIKNEIIEIINESDIIPTVAKKMENEEADDLDYYFFEPTIQHIKDSVAFSTEKKIIAIFKEFLNNIDFTFPAKPRKKRINKVEKAIANYFCSTDEHNIDDFTEALEEVTTENVVKRWVKLFKLLTSVANGLTAEQGLR